MTHPELGPCWLVIRYSLVRALLSDPRLVKPVEERDGNSLDSPPPVHTRLRRLVQLGFTHARVQRLRSWAGQLADQIADDMAAEGRVDLVTRLADPLPIAVIGHMLGVPASDGGGPRQCPRLPRRRERGAAGRGLRSR